MKRLFCLILSTSLYAFSFDFDFDNDLSECPENDSDNMFEGYEFQETSSINRDDCTFAGQIQQINIPFTINTSGQYCVVGRFQNIFANTSNTPNNLITIPAGQTAITITADNVVLDLNDQFIRGEPNSGTAIFISGNRTNITIRNGVIADMGGSAISMNNSVQLMKIKNVKLFRNNNGIVGGALRNSVIQDCIISFNRANGIFMTQFGTLPSQNCVIQNCILTFNALNGLQCVNGINININNVLLSNNGGTGLLIPNGNRCNVQNCQVNNNGTNGTFASGNGHSFINCTANNNVGIGFQLLGNRTNVAQCQTKGNSSDGFRINGTNHTFMQCTSESNRTPTTAAIGFNITGNQHSFEECIAKDNGTGFQIVNSNNCILNCLAKNNTAFGFWLQSTSNQCQVRNNTALANNIGFENDDVTLTNRIYSNYSSDNTTANYVGIANTFTSPTAFTAINATANIAN